MPEHEDMPHRLREHEHVSVSQCLTGTNSLPHKSGKPLLYKPGQNISPSMNVVKQAFAKKNTKACGAYLEGFAVANY